MGCTKKQLQRLQRILHYAIRMVDQLDRTDAVDMALQRQGWLSIEQRAQLRLALISTTTLKQGAPRKLTSLLVPGDQDASETNMVLRSQTQGLLTIPRTKTAAGGRAFAVAAPQLLNSLPQQAREGGASRDEIVSWLFSTV